MSILRRNKYVSKFIYNRLKRSNLKKSSYLSRFKFKYSLEQEIKDAIYDNKDRIQDIQTVLVAALVTLNTLSDLVCQDNEDIKALWEETKKDLVDSFHCATINKKRPAMVMLRGVLEGFLTALYYREQGIALTLWASNTDFVMAHTLLDPKHEFYKYFNRLFKDERFNMDYPNIAQNACFKEAVELYDLLSSEVHKKRTPRFLHDGNNWITEYFILVNRTFRVGISFLERVEEIPELMFPSPTTFPAQIIFQNTKRKNNGK